jgi:hypothetical protein
MTDWYTKTVLTIIAVCLLFLAGREAAAPSRNFELSRGDDLGTTNEKDQTRHLRQSRGYCNPSRRCSEPRGHLVNSPAPTSAAPATKELSACRSLLVDPGA